MDDKEDGQKHRVLIVVLIEDHAESMLEETPLGSSSEYQSTMTKLKKLSHATRCWSTSPKMKTLISCGNLNALSPMRTRDHKSMS
jgi:hypothetical protein